MSAFPPNARFVSAFFVVSVVCAATSLAQAEEPQPPLRARIDQLISAQSGGMVAPIASDAEFLRRVSLDLVGMPPTASELRDFLADTSFEKRQSAVDRLLASPRFARHMAQTFDLMLMERRPALHVSADEWQNYLVESFRANKPFDQLAREILSADGADPALRAAARFYLDRESEPNLITRDVGRIFFGQDLQCAQCHDHPNITDYHQSDYQGLLAFFEPGYALVKKEGDKEKTYYAERAGSDREFESVFIKGRKRLTGPRLPGAMEIAEPEFYPGDEYTVKPADGVLPAPKFSRRRVVAEQATNGTNRAFNENIVNRLWAHMMGRGLVHPVDLHHSSNPPSYPELLALLGSEFAVMKFDTKAFLRELALTQTYQRSIDVPGDVLEQARQAVELAEQLETQRETLAKALEESQVAYEKVAESWSNAEQTLVPVVAELVQVRTKAGEAAKRVDDATKTMNEARQTLAGKQSAVQPLLEIGPKAQEIAAKMPQDAELVAAAQKIVEKAGQAQGEIETLKKVVDEKSAVLQGTMGEMNTARQAVDTVVEKVKPVEEVERTAEQTTIDARALYEDAATKLVGFDQRLDKVQAFAKIAELDAQANASQKQLADAQAAIDAARAALDGFAPTVQAGQASLEAARGQQAKAIEVLAAGEAEYARRKSYVDSMEAAAQAVEVALVSLPGDAALAEASTKFRAKGAQFAVELADYAPLLDGPRADLKASEEKVAMAQADLDKTLAEQATKAQALAAAESERDQLSAVAAEHRQTVDKTIAELAESWTADFTIATLKPLTPEQICWSALRVTGVEDRYRAAEEAELTKSAPLAADATAEQQLARAREIEQRTYDKLKGSVDAFIRVFAAGAGQPQSDFFATADQALFVTNGEAMNDWTAPAADNVSQRVVAEADMTKAAEDLYLTVLSRMPSAEEAADVQARLVAAKEKPVVVQELVWGLMTSAEFRFNH